VVQSRSTPGVDPNPRWPTLVRGHASTSSSTTSTGGLSYRPAAYRPTKSAASVSFERTRSWIGYARANARTVRSIGACTSSSGSTVSRCNMSPSPSAMSARAAGTGSAEVSGDPVLLERMVTNLIDNATRYNLPEGGRVLIPTRATAEGATLLVENTGPVIAAYEIPGLYEPFRRLPSDDRETSQGSGLGLSIVRAVVRAHVGRIDATPGDRGGLAVTVRLPLHSVA
jgi:hypothetical protein